MPLKETVIFQNSYYQVTINSLFYLDRADWNINIPFLSTSSVISSTPTRKSAIKKEITNLHVAELQAFSLSQVNAPSTAHLFKGK